jgi:hypothetical protein
MLTPNKKGIRLLPDECPRIIFFGRLKFTELSLRLSPPLNAEQLKGIESGLRNIFPYHYPQMSDTKHRVNVLVLLEFDLASFFLRYCFFLLDRFERSRLKHDRNRAPPFLRFHFVKYF